MIKKINFPRITLPVILFFSSTLNFIIIFSIFLLFLLVVGRFPGASLFAYIPLLVLQQAFALGLGMMLGTMNIFFRDIGQFMGIVLQFWFWLTPIIYPISILPDQIQPIITFNPMTRIMASYQQIILNQQWPVWRELYPQIILAATALIFGLFVFRRLSGDLVDEL
jgi:lipopolysaccharide transport system permease protein